VTIWGTLQVHFKHGSDEGADSESPRFKVKEPHWQLSPFSAPEKRLKFYNKAEMMKVEGELLTTANFKGRIFFFLRCNFYCLADQRLRDTRRTASRLQL